MSIAGGGLQVIVTFLALIELDIRLCGAEVGAIKKKKNSNKKKILRPMSSICSHNPVFKPEMVLCKHTALVVNQITTHILM